MRHTVGGVMPIFAGGLSSTGRHRYEQSERAVRRQPTISRIRLCLDSNEQSAELAIILCRRCMIDAIEHYRRLLIENNRGKLGAANITEMAYTSACQFISATRFIRRRECGARPSPRRAIKVTLRRLISILCNTIFVDFWRPARSSRQQCRRIMIMMLRRVPVDSRRPASMSQDIGVMISPRVTNDGHLPSYRRRSRPPGKFVHKSIN